MDNPNTENPSGANVTLEQPSAQTPTSEIQTSVDGTSTTTDSTPQTVEAPTITATDALNANPPTPTETSNAASSQNKSFWQKINPLNRMGSIIPPSQSEPSTHNAVFQERQNKIDTANPTMPEHLADGTTPTVPNVTAEAHQNAEASSSAPKFSQDTIPLPTATPTEIQAETSTPTVTETPSVTTPIETPTPTTTELSEQDSNPNPLDVTAQQPVMDEEPRPPSIKPPIPITKPIENFTEPALTSTDVSSANPETATEAPNAESDDILDQTTKVTQNAGVDTLGRTPTGLETPSETTTSDLSTKEAPATPPTGDVLNQTTNVVTDAEQVEDALPKDGAKTPRLETPPSTTDDLTETATSETLDTTNASLNLDTITPTGDEKIIPFPTPTEPDPPDNVTPIRPDVTPEAQTPEQIVEAKASVGPMPIKTTESEERPQAA